VTIVEDFSTNAWIFTGNHSDLCRKPLDESTSSWEADANLTLK